MQFVSRCAANFQSIWHQQKLFLFDDGGLSQNVRVWFRECSLNSRHSHWETVAVAVFKIDEPKSSKINDLPKSSEINDEPKSSENNDEPKSLKICDEPKSWETNNEPNHQKLTMSQNHQKSTMS